jgi:hypothetical protein
MLEQTTQTCQGPVPPLHCPTLAASHSFSAVDWSKMCPQHQTGVACIHSIQFLVRFVDTCCRQVDRSKPLLIQYPESDDTDDAASMIGELSLDENKEVCPDVINMRTQLSRVRHRRCGIMVLSAVFICYPKPIARMSAKLAVSGESIIKS